MVGNSPDTDINDNNADKYQMDINDPCYVSENTCHQQ